MDQKHKHTHTQTHAHIYIYTHHTKEPDRMNERVICVIYMSYIYRQTKGRFYQALSYRILLIHVGILPYPKNLGASECHGPSADAFRHLCTLRE